MLKSFLTKRLLLHIKFLPWKKLSIAKKQSVFFFLRWKISWAVTSLHFCVGKAPPLHVDVWRHVSYKHHFVQTLVFVEWYHTFTVIFPQKSSHELRLVSSDGQEYKNKENISITNANRPFFGALHLGAYFVVLPTNPPKRVLCKKWLRRVFWYAAWRHYANGLYSPRILPEVSKTPSLHTKRKKNGKLGELDKGVAK